ncbi:probable 28S ribosomal protein S16, mitochondrial [Orussus abietinus]|uniref:probable 28S ribosomal protein S16, mitochondrial n=1 Tax=Orussus abietinus TaxID=222816 RepID=UPI0006258506|nr:probable 28S ribosomal protein S16, mitochondrial [Orussus abietinus]
MTRMPLHAASGTGIYKDLTTKVIRLVRYGCTNRHFLHIVVMETKKHPKSPPIEQLGTFDICVNENNEKLVAFNFERVQFWLSKGAKVTDPVAKLLGLAGYFPIHPRTYMTAWRNRKHAEEVAAADAEKASAEKATAETN